MKTFVSILAASLFVWTTQSQQTTPTSPNPSNTRVVRVYGNNKTEFEALRNDTSVKNGYYHHYYKDKLIEKGQYNMNSPVGLWQYYNLKGIFEFEYNHDAQTVTRLSGNRDPKTETPCLFKGSPLVPYLYIVQKVGYPEEALRQNLSGEVVLALKINKEGEVWAMYLSKKLHPVLDAEVMRVARGFPSGWQWLPATRLGEPVDGEYSVSIEFEL
ncbi:MAG: energy transducer TonB [Breznakibacter sp.]